MIVNGVEKLTCITPIREVTRDGGTIRVEPLHNFPVVSDLVVDLAPLYTRMEEIGAASVLPVDVLPDAGGGIGHGTPPATLDDEPVLRLVDCIECGLCISACPVQATDPDYLGPAVIAAAHLQNIAENRELCALLEGDEGVWRCHSAFECTAVCPSNVEPAWRIMDTRRNVVRVRLHQLVTKNQGERR